MILFFYLFASLLLFSAFMVITSRNPVYSVLWLIFTFCNAAGLMVLLGAEFIAMMLVIIYVGAVAVLFLFVVMMLNINFRQIKTYSRKEILLYSGASFIFFIDLALIILLGSKTIKLPPNNILTISTEISNVAHIGSLLYTKFILVFQTCGIILFAAMVACISLTLDDKRPKRNLLQQKVRKQLARTKQNSISIAKLTGKEGLNNLNYDD